LLFGFSHAPLAAAFVLGNDSNATSMKRGRAEQFATDRPVADVPPNRQSTPIDRVDESSR
jgi:hypothetical protein